MVEDVGLTVPQYILEVTREGSKVGRCDGSETFGSDMMIIAHSLGPGIDCGVSADSVDDPEGASTVPAVERVISLPSRCVDRESSS